MIGAISAARSAADDERDGDERGRARTHAVDQMAGRYLRAEWPRKSAAVNAPTISSDVE